MVARRTKPKPVIETDVVDYLSEVVARLERLGDRLEAYADSAVPPIPLEGPRDAPPSS